MYRRYEDWSLNSAIQEAVNPDLQQKNSVVGVEGSPLLYPVSVGKNGTNSTISWSGEEPRVRKSEIRSKRASYLYMLNGPHTWNILMQAGRPNRFLHQYPPLPPKQIPQTSVGQNLPPLGEESKETVSKPNRKYSRSFKFADLCRASRKMNMMCPYCLSLSWLYTFLIWVLFFEECVTFFDQFFVNTIKILAESRSISQFSVESSGIGFVFK